MRFDRIDQDKYEMPGLFFRATDQYGMYGAPTMVFDEVKVDGKWMKGPVLLNLYGHWNTDAIVWNLPVVPGDHYATYNSAMVYLKGILAKNGRQVLRDPAGRDCPRPGALQAGGAEG